MILTFTYQMTCFLIYLLITGKHVSGKTSLLSDSNNSSVETVDFCNSLQ